MSNKPYRGTLEICEEIRDAEAEILALRAELYARTGKGYEEFVAGMRALLAPETISC